MVTIVESPEVADLWRAGLGRREAQKQHGCAAELRERVSREKFWAVKGVWLESERGGGRRRQRRGQRRNRVRRGRLPSCGRWW